MRARTPYGTPCGPRLFLSHRVAVRFATRRAAALEQRQRVAQVVTAAGTAWAVWSA